MNLTRACYLVAVCSGLRAMFNLLLSTKYDLVVFLVLMSVVVNLDDSGLARIRVHGKRRPANGCSSAKYGMISLELVHSGVHPLLDRILLLMSHFGCGHLELAYMDKDDRLEIYAVRNVAKRLPSSPEADFFIFEADDNGKRVPCVEQNPFGFEQPWNQLWVGVASRMLQAGDFTGAS